MHGSTEGIFILGDWKTNCVSRLQKLDQSVFVVASQINNTCILSYLKDAEYTLETSLCLFVKAM